MTIKISGPPLVVKTCVNRLVVLAGDLEDPAEGAPSRSGTGATPGKSSEEMLLVHGLPPAEQPDLACDVTWHPPGPWTDLPGSETTVQATSGIAHLHGLERGEPTRVGLDVASVAAGILASQGVLAALVAAARGRPFRQVQLSVTHAALIVISQYIARATASEDWREWVLARPGPQPGPPFRTRDGHWVELDTLSSDAWTSFWLHLGVDRSVLGRAWTLFHARYSTATCTMPDGFHQAVRRRTLAEISEVARDCGVSLCPIRSHEEVLQEPGTGASEFPVLSFPPRSAAPRRPCSPRPATVASPVPTADPSLPLNGIRVIEVTSRIQGPLAGQLLRMLGADVIRVEPPGGDPNRLASPSAGATGAFFLCVNRNKDAVELALHRPDDRAQLVDLVADIDVFLHNWRAGRAAEWKLDFDDLKEHNPDLVYCAASGWGAMAPNCPPIGMEFLVQAYAGLGNAIQPQGCPPLPSRVLLVDVMGALLACEGILAGLYRRERTGQGGRVDTSLLAGAMALQANVLGGDRDTSGRGPVVPDNLTGGLETADGHVFVTLADVDALHRLCACCGLSSKAAVDERVEQAIRARLMLRSSTEWQELLLGAGIPCGIACSDLKSLVADPAVGGCLERVEEAWMPSRPWTFRCP